MPRAARAPHSSKIPDACPHCGSHVLTRRGSRKKKLEIVQLWRCASCKRTFTPGPQALRNKTYPLRTVIDATGGFGTLLLMGHEWQPREQWERSMHLFVDEVMPRLGTPSLAHA